MRQLSENDAAYIYSDTAHANSNISLLHIYDQSTAPGGVVRFKQILSHVESRLHLLPMFRERIVRVPLTSITLLGGRQQLQPGVPRAPHRLAQTR